MPKYGIHHIILDETIEALRQGDPTAQAAARLLERFPFEANMGAIGPDLFFFLEDYDIISMVNMAKPVLEFFAEIAEVVEEIVEPFIKIHDAVGQAAEATLDTLGLSALTNVKDSLEATEKLFNQLVNQSIASGMLEKVLPLQTSTDYRFNATSTFTRMIREMFEDYLVPPLQRNVEEPDWYWFDMLHYRNTGDFAKALVRNADTDQKKAYALAYLTHIGTDLVGHPYVNQIVGGPFRLGVQRHVTVENFMDVQAYQEKYGQEISETLYDDLGFEQDFPAGIAQLLATAARETYTDIAHPHLLNSAQDQVNATYFENGIFTADHVQSAYKLMRITLKMMGGNKDLTPTPPTDTADMDLSEIMAELESLDPPPAPPTIPGLPPASYESLFSGEMTIADLGELLAASGVSVAEWADSMAAYLAEFAAYCMETAKLLLVLAKNMLANTADFLTRDLLALLYGIQKTLFEMLQASRQILALNGLMYPHSTQINDAASQSLLTISDPDLHYVANDTNLAGLKGRLYPKLRAKGQSHLMAPMYETECMATIPAFHTPASIPNQSVVTPQHFMRQEPFSAAALAAYANANSPEQAAQLRENGHVIGNAVALCSWMIRNAENSAEENTVFANWNLDGDRGYGAKSWSGILPPNTDYSSQAKQAFQLANPGIQTQISATDAMPFLHRICDTDPANDYKFANIKAKQERFENQRRHSDF
ncbi:MAG TPA: hypothetical protein EYG79_11580, partial [Rhodobacteraceae bacterium]|nr:hypothetical protein [Paracoccaceae bacterium]